MKLSNEAARHLAIHCTGLTPAPTGPCSSDDLLTMIKDLGYVQLDPLKVVARAHDHILWSRNNQYRPPMLDQLLAEDQHIFEHFCHDACVLPMDTLPFWKNQFKRQSEKLTSDSWRTNLPKKDKTAILKRIEKEGQLRSIDFKSVKPTSKKEVWSRPEHKRILDYLWLKGELAVSERKNFSKYYNLSSRVLCEKRLNTKVTDAKRIDWLSSHALQNLGFATNGEIMRFWDACDLNEIKRWQEKNIKTLYTVSVESYDGQYADYVSTEALRSVIQKPPKPTARMRIISPFDPLARDRKRLERLFGFEYRIEIYTPPEKRRYGYYVYPLLEFDAFVGRIEVRHDRQTNTIKVDNLWAEPGVNFGKGRMTKLSSELERLRRFCQADEVIWTK